MPAKSRQGCSTDDGCRTGVSSNTNEHAAACCDLPKGCNSKETLDLQQNFRNARAEAHRTLEGGRRDVTAPHCCTRCCNDTNGNIKAHDRHLDCAKCCEAPHRKRNRNRMSGWTRKKSNTKKRKRETGNSPVHSQQDCVNVNFKKLPEDKLEEDVSQSGSLPNRLLQLLFCSTI